MFLLLAAFVTLFSLCGPLYSAVILCCKRHSVESESVIVLLCTPSFSHRHSSASELYHCSLPSFIQVLGVRQFWTDLPPLSFAPPSFGFHFDEHFDSFDTHPALVANPVTSLHLRLYSPERFDIPSPADAVPDAIVWRFNF